MQAPSGKYPSKLDVITSRRQFLIATAGVAAVASLPMKMLAADSDRTFKNPNQMKGRQCIKAFSETDQTENLKKIDVPTLILQGDDDQIVPIGDSGMLSAKLVKNATFKI